MGSVKEAKSDSENVHPAEQARQERTIEEDQQQKGQKWKEAHVDQMQ